MIRAELEIFVERGRRPIRSLHWLPVFVLTVILASLLSSTAQSQDCQVGEYLTNEDTKPSTSSPGTGNTEMTTGSSMETTGRPNCRNCSEAIEYCVLCALQNNSVVVCDNCTSGYELKDNNCTVPYTSTPSSNTKTIIIAVVVSVVGVLVLAGVIVGIALGVRRGAFEKCHCPCAAPSSTPPPMPAPDDLGVSFTNKTSDEESGTGQRVDLRYTEEPGATQNRVESVHYDGYPGTRDDDSVYMNDIIRSIPATVQEEDEYANTDVQDDELYVNTEGLTSPSNQRMADTARNTRPTQVPGSSISPSNQRMADAPTNSKPTKVPGGSKPPRPRPKPQTPAKPNSATKTKAQLVTPETPRGSMYPPEVPEDIYTNEQEPEDEDDDEDYVNTEAYQQGKR